MKARVEKSEEERGELKFPVLMESRGNGTIVLFTSKNTGTCVYQGEGEQTSLGAHGTNWISASSTTQWKPFTGKVILEN